MADYDFDLVVVGSGPAGQRAAIQAAKLGKNVAVEKVKYIIDTVFNYPSLAECNKAAAFDGINRLD